MYRRNGDGGIRPQKGNTMLSAVKNFALTFLISLLVFALCAYYIVGYVLTNLSVISGGSGATETTQPPAPVITDDKGTVIEIPDTGASFNLLVAVTDYDPTLYNYDPDTVGAISSGVISRPSVEPLPVPKDLASPRRVSVAPDSDPEDKTEEITNGENGDPQISGGFYSARYKKIRTPQTLLIRFDREQSQVTFSSFPDAAYVVMDDRYVSLGDIYAKYGKQTLCDTIHSLTGCKIDNSIVIHPDGLKMLVDNLGGVYLNVPHEIPAANEAEEPINSGGQVIKGDNIWRVLSYDGEGAARDSVIVELARAAISGITQITNYPNADSLYDKLSVLVDTDFTKEAFMSNKDFIFRYSQLRNTSIEPSLRMFQFGDSRISVIDEQATLSKFSSIKREFSAETTAKQ